MVSMMLGAHLGRDEHLASIETVLCMQFIHGEAVALWLQLQCLRKACRKHRVMSHVVKQHGLTEPTTEHLFGCHSAMPLSFETRQSALACFGSDCHDGRSADERAMRESPQKGPY